MSIAIIVDSTCDLPQHYVADNNVEILPIDLLLNGETYKDTKNPLEIAAFFSGDQVSKMVNAQSLPLSVEQICDIFYKKIVTKYGYALVLTAAKGRSNTYENAVQASLSINKNYQSYRKAAGLESGFTMRVINSGTLFAGLGIATSYAVDLVANNTSKVQLRQKVEEFKSNIYTYCIPSDLFYLRTRAKTKGDKSVGLMTALIGKALDVIPVILGHMDDTQPVAKIKGHNKAVDRVFDHTIEQIDQGLKIPRVVISIAGEIEWLHQFDGYHRLLKKAKTESIEVLSSVMSIAGGVNLGPGTITVGFASDPHTFVS